MSFLRLFSPTRIVEPIPGPSTHSRIDFTPLPQYIKTDDGITLHLQVATFGCVFMSPPPGPMDTEPRDDTVFNGSVQVFLPPGMGSKRSKAIRVRLWTEICLDLGPGRMGEKDVLFERMVELSGVEQGVLILREGLQRFDFAIIIPADLTPHDTHHNARIEHFLSAEVIGRESIGRKGKGRSPSSSNGSSPGATDRPRLSFFGSRSPSRSPGPSSPSLLASTAVLSISNEDGLKLPEVPPYEEHDDRVGWLEGSLRVRRNIMLFYNPDPLGGVSTLNDHSTGYAPGLGAYDVRLLSDVWSVCALLQARLMVPNLDPRVTIFAFTVILVQTHRMTSPRDDPTTAKAIDTRLQFPVIEIGKRPPPEHHHPSKDMPALWRGLAAGGTDTGDLETETIGRLPNDDLARPSTVPGVESYIKTSHKLVVQVFFSVWGETAQGQPMPRKDVGGLRVMKIERPVVIPSCVFVPRSLDLPTYEVSSAPPWVQATGPCPLCKTNRDKPYCMTCVSTSIPHLRHDHDPKLVGDPRGICPLCEAAVVPMGVRRRDDFNCACGESLEMMQERMRLATQAGTDPSVGSLTAAEATKREAEGRGRQ